jgi:hypothetical protein
MRTLVSAITAVALMALAGCATHVAPIAPGRPAFHSGSPVGYWVWHDDGGWHLRTTTHRSRHRFHGWITAIDGRVDEVRPTRLEWRDRVHVGQRGVEFDFETDGDEDGFDWRVTSGCNRFELLVDGRADRRVVHLGGPGYEPKGVPFSRCR